jgi:hypothetical protein
MHAGLRQTAETLRDKFPPAFFAACAAALVFKLEEGVPVSGIELK